MRLVVLVASLIWFDPSEQTSPKETISSIATSPKETISSLATSTKETISSIATSPKETISSFATSTKEALSSVTGSVKGSIDNFKIRNDIVTTHDECEEIRNPGHVDKALEVAKHTVSQMRKENKEKLKDKKKGELEECINKLREMVTKAWKDGVIEIEDKTNHCINGWGTFKVHNTLQSHHVVLVKINLPCNPIDGEESAKPTEIGKTSETKTPTDKDRTTGTDESADKDESK
ncbi:uncharacterized protein LOC129001154 [Macrosteles quadrilineatus]|uniref:uncharacterized protein LOC129001154 n=1 Tax=Macrosteles quadrilineatus TaxID=74068 RepID=UPI0023E0EB54|nr:uncharacterized protein LOC129001154 [Macrosteles quadrilineatus]